MMSPYPSRRLARLSVRAVIALAVLAGATTAASAASAASGTRPSCTRDVCVFVLSKGRLTAFDAPGPAPQDLVRVNNRGQIVGGIREAVADEGFRGYRRDQRGKFSRIDFPGAAGTSPFDLNDRGQIVGIYSKTDTNTGRAGDKRGFLLDRGRFTTLHVPGAVTSQAFGINNRGQVVGEYLDAGGRIHGYLWDRGRFTTVDGPDGAAGASLTDINDRGQIVGVYAFGDPNIPPTDPEALDGFLLSGGVYRTFDTPGPGATFPFGINNRGQIVVSTTTGMLNNAQGFLLPGAAGHFTPIDPPGPVGAPGTLLATGINDAGTIVGLAANPNAPPDVQRSTAPMPMLMSRR